MNLRAGFESQADRVNRRITISPLASIPIRSACRPFFCGTSERYQRSLRANSRPILRATSAAAESAGESAGAIEAVDISQRWN